MIHEVRLHDEVNMLVIASHLWEERIDTPTAIEPSAQPLARRNSSFFEGGGDKGLM
jgi:hypothetical protein